MNRTEIATATARRQHFARQLPKIELHAHLNGSIRRSTLRELAAGKNVNPNHAVILSKTPKTLSDAFDVFAVIHSCVTTLQDVERLAYELGQDLEEDGVVYAEIRTTPRVMASGDDHGMVEKEDGLDEYVRAVLDGFARYSGDMEDATRSNATASASNKVILRLLLSIDRAKHSSTQAFTVVELAHRYRCQGVVGIDLSGDPTKGQWSTFAPALAQARSLGLKVTLHAGEVRDRDEEMSRMLDFAPDRFGHCCFVSPSNLERLKASGIPIELCLTSNLLSNSVTELKDHHFGLHYDHVDSSAKGNGKTICCISTDDSGVFGSPLSNEYRLVMETFGLTEEETFHLARRTAEATFLIPIATNTMPTDREGSNEAGAKTRNRDREDLERIQSRFRQFQESWDWL